jgi:hypothetical protein
MALLGGMGLLYLQLLSDSILAKQAKANPVHELCQSCGKRFNYSVRHGNFTPEIINPYFCIECFDSGSFTRPDLKVEDVIAIHHPNFNRYSKFDKWRYSIWIKELDRWQKGTL